MLIQANGMLLDQNMTSQSWSFYNWVNQKWLTTTFRSSMLNGINQQQNNEFRITKSKP